MLVHATKPQQCICLRVRAQVGACFSTLLVGIDGTSRVYARPSDERHAQRRREAMSAFQRFAVEAVRRTHAMRGWRPLDLLPRASVQALLLLP